MSDDAYGELLDATVQHLETLREHGVRYLNVAPELLADVPQPKASSPRTAATRSAPRRAAAPPPLPVPPLPAAPVPVPPGRAAQASLTLARPTQGLSRTEKETAMAALQARALGCRKCAHLAAVRQHVVFGVGDIHSPLLFVGEAPGADEDAQGEPFVGKAGQLLTRIIQTMGLERDRVYIANILKCRPDTPGQSSGNRKPTPTEMGTCLPYLLEQIDLIQPRVIVALGVTAVEGLLGKTDGISRARGQWLTFRDTPVMPTYHPAYLLRNQALSVKRLVWEDMLAVMARLGLPISAKQRGYFLKT